ATGKRRLVLRPLKDGRLPPRSSNPTKLPMDLNQDHPTRCGWLLIFSSADIALRLPTICFAQQERIFHEAALSFERKEIRPTYHEFWRGLLASMGYRSSQYRPHSQMTTTLASVRKDSFRWKFLRSRYWQENRAIRPVTGCCGFFCNSNVDLSLYRYRSRS